MVTCYEEPALGGVYKLAQYRTEPRIKVSGDPLKTNIPGNKELFRCYVELDGNELMKMDIMELDTNLKNESLQFPQVCHNPYSLDESISLPKELFTKVEPMLKLLFKDGERNNKKLSWKEARMNMENDLAHLSKNYYRIENPDPYKIYISDSLNKIRQSLILKYEK